MEQKPLNNTQLPPLSGGTVIQVAFPPEKIPDSPKECCCWHTVWAAAQGQGEREGYNNTRTGR